MKIPLWRLPKCVTFFWPWFFVHLEWSDWHHITQSLKHYPIASIFDVGWYPTLLFRIFLGVDKGGRRVSQNAKTPIWSKKWLLTTLGGPKTVLWPPCDTMLTLYCSPIPSGVILCKLTSLGTLKSVLMVRHLQHASEMIIMWLWDDHVPIPVEVMRRLVPKLGKPCKNVFQTFLTQYVFTFRSLRVR